MGYANGLEGQKLHEQGRCQLYSTGARFVQPPEPPSVRTLRGDTCPAAGYIGILVMATAGEVYIRVR